jgi:hypothetical protein
MMLAIPSRDVRRDLAPGDLPRQRTDLALVVAGLEGRRLRLR